MPHAVPPDGPPATPTPPPYPPSDLPLIPTRHLFSPPLLLDPLVWSGRLRSCAAEWSEEARRLRLLLGSPGVSGACGRAIAACGDEVADEMSRIARQLGSAGSVASLQPGQPPTPGQLR